MKNGKLVLIDDRVLKCFAHRVNGEHYIEKGLNLGIELMEDLIKNLPEVNAEDFVPKGKWKWDETVGSYVCPRCKATSLNNPDGGPVSSNFCPNCGLKFTDLSNYAIRRI